MSTQPFQVQLVPTSLAVTAVAQSIAWTTMVPAGVNQPQPMGARLANVGTQVIYWLQSSGTTVTVVNGTPLMPNTAESFNLQSGVALQVIAAAVGSTLTVSMGEGL